MQCLIVRCALIGALFCVSAAPALGAGPEPVSKMSWRNIGPFVGGRVVAVAGVPSDQNLFYMGGVDGGIWKSTDYGLVWTNITDGTFTGSNSIGALAVAPSDPNTIYAGTGESDIRGDVITGNGVYKSTDAGKTWSYAGLADTHTISAIAVDPANKQVVYASSMGHVFADNSDRGVFKSTDGGKTWHKVLFVDAGTGAIDLVMDQKHPDVLYAAMWQAYRKPWMLSSGGPGSGLYKTTDGGAHWTEISRNSGFAAGPLGRMGIAVSAGDPNIVYAIAQAKEGGVFRSTDAGKTWHRVNSEWKLRQRAFYYMCIFIDPTNPNTVYVPNVDALWVSRDGGEVFSKLRPPHGDNHIVWVNPNNPKILLEGNDGGATVSTDGGQSWSQEHNQPTGQFYHVSIDDQFPFHVFGAQQDEGSSEGPSASIGGDISNDLWRDVAYGESTFVARDPEVPNVTYGSGYFSIFLRYDAITGEDRSVSPWPLYTEGASSNELKYRFGWTHPILFNPADPKQLLAGSQFVMSSHDDGATWQAISPDLTRNDPTTEGPTGGPIDLDQTSAEVYPDVSALAPSPLDKNVIWAGSSDGLVHLTTDGGATWKTVTPPALPEWCEITSIEASHADKATAYLTASRYMWDDFHPFVYATTDDGQTWHPIVAGVPVDEYAFVVREDPRDADLLFLGTKNTVYFSTDRGAQWQPLSLNLPRVQVRDLAIDTRQNDVVVATHGRAFWILDNLSLLEQLTKSNGAAPADLALYAPSTAWLTHAFGQNGFAARNPVGTNPPFGATVFFKVPPGYDGRTPVSLSFSDAQGHVIRTFSLHLRAKERPLSSEALDQLTPSQLKARDDAKLTAIDPGMNAFQWDLRYPDATEVTGYNPPVPAGGLEDLVQGPTVGPGTYTVMLDYGGRKLQQSFGVALDPRITAAPDDLAARLGLALRVHADLDSVDRLVDEAMSLRDRSTGATAAALDNAIAGVVDMRVGRSSEGGLLHETQLRDHLAFLASELDLAYAAPTAAQVAVFNVLDGDVIAREQALEAAIAAAKGTSP